MNKEDKLLLVENLSKKFDNKIKRFILINCNYNW